MPFGVDTMMIFAFLTDAVAATACEYTAGPFSMNAASSNIRIETAEIPRAAFGPEERAYILHPLKSSILSLFLDLNIDLVFFELVGSGDQ